MVNIILTLFYLIIMNVDYTYVYIFAQPSSIFKANLNIIFKGNKTKTISSPVIITVVAINLKIQEKVKS